MKAKSTLIIACLALAALMIVGTTRAEAQCCGLDLLAAPFVAAGAIVEGAAVISYDIVTAPFYAFSCGTCGINFCNSCKSPKVGLAPGNYGQY
jgi:hypothetical protein